MMDPGPRCEFDAAQMVVRVQKEVPGQVEAIPPVVEQIMERFARNMAAAASGKTVSDAAPAGGIGLLLTGLWRRLRRWLGS